MKKQALSFEDRLSLKIQRVIGWLTFPFWGSLFIFLMRFIGRYRIPRIKEIRKRYQKLMQSNKEPVLVCANHLTKIDSALINWSLASEWTYLKSFNWFPWNLPERARYEKNIFLRLSCYLGSCIPIDRRGDRDVVKKSLDKLVFLLKKGYPVTIFPEGQRSRTGRLDSENFSYSVGRLFRAVKNCKVLCIYMRGQHQKKETGIPEFGDKFYFDMKLITPKSVYEGLRATRDIATQIIHQLKNMEQAYFATSR